MKDESQSVMAFLCGMGAGVLVCILIVLLHGCSAPPSDTQCPEGYVYAPHAHECIYVAPIPEETSLDGGPHREKYEPSRMCGRLSCQ